MKYKFLEHTADIKFRAFGDNKEEAFTNSALALKESICGEIKVKEEKKKNIKIEGRDFESLLYNFLEEILYLFDAENFLISKIKKMEINEFKLKAVIAGDRASKYEFTNPVKAVTYNDMFIKKKGNKWIAQVVLDV